MPQSDSQRFFYPYENVENKSARIDKFTKRVQIQMIRVELENFQKIFWWKQARKIVWQPFQWQFFRCSAIFFSHHYVRSVHSAGSMLYVLNKSGDRCAEKFHNFSHNKRPNIGFRYWSHNRAYGFRLWEFSRVPFMVLRRFLMNVYCSGFSSVDYSVLYELFKTRIRSLNRHC